MKLGKEIKTKLHKAKGKSIEIPWNAPYDPKKGHTYALPEFGEDTRLLVLKEWVDAEGQKVLAKLNHDPHYILHGLNGTRNDAGDYVPEPEAIRPSAIQAHMLAGRAKTELAGKERRNEGKTPQREQRLLELRRRGMTSAAQRVEEQIARSRLAEAS